MQIDKVKQILRKIQALVENMEEHGETSALERDLLKRYLADMYEQVALSGVDLTAPNLSPGHDGNHQSAEAKSRTEHLQTPEMPVSELRHESVTQNPVANEVMPRGKDEARSESSNAEAEEPSPTINEFGNAVKYFPPSEPEDEMQPEYAEAEYSEEKQRFAGVKPAISELFSASEASDLASKLQNRKLARIEDGFGINERLLTINTLFGGSTQKFNDTVRKLNDLESFDEAREMLSTGVAREYEWGSAERSKNAIEFIRTVRRKYQP